MSTTPSNFSYSNDALTALRLSLSEERLSSYLKKCPDASKAIELYLWNKDVSEALYGSLQGFEIVLRNSLNRELCAKHGDEWYKNTKPVLFSESQFERIEKAINNFNKDRKDRGMIVSDVVARMSFGFWSDILHYEMYDELWKTCLYKAFPNRAKGTKRNTLAPVVKRLKDLRNRVAHHEPIWQYDLKRDHAAIITLTSWICPLTSSWIQHHSRFDEIAKLNPKAAAKESPA